MYSMEKIKITNPKFFYNITNESGEEFDKKDINNLFNEAVGIIRNDLISKKIEPSIQNIFSEENIKVLEYHLKKRFPNMEIDLKDLIKGGFKMGDMDDLVELFNKKTQETMQPLKSKIDELVNSNQELVNSNQDLLKKVELLRNKKNIPVQLFLDIKKNNPNLSDEEALKLAKQQIDNLGELS